MLHCTFATYKSVLTYLDYDTPDLAVNTYQAVALGCSYNTAVQMFAITKSSRPYCPATVSPEELALALVRKRPSKLFH